MNAEDRDPYGDQFNLSDSNNNTTNINYFDTNNNSSDPNNTEQQQTCQHSSLSAHSSLVNLLLLKSLLPYLGTTSSTGIDDDDNDDSSTSFDSMLQNKIPNHLLLQMCRLTNTIHYSSLSSFRNHLPSSSSNDDVNDDDNDDNHKKNKAKQNTETTTTRGLREKQHEYTRAIRLLIVTAWNKGLMNDLTIQCHEHFFDFDLFKLVQSCMMMIPMKKSRNTTNHVNVNNTIVLRENQEKMNQLLQQYSWKKARRDKDENNEDESAWNNTANQRRRHGMRLMRGTIDFEQLLDEEEANDDDDDEFEVPMITDYADEEDDEEEEEIAEEEEEEYEGSYLIEDEEREGKSVSTRNHDESDDERDDSDMYMIITRNLSGYLSFLETIDLSGCVRLTDRSLLLISSACGGGQLKKLFLNGCSNITGEFNKMHIVLPSSLVALSIESCEQFVDIDLNNLTNLQYLNVSNTEMKIFCYRELKQLKTLLCSGNALEDDLLDTLTHNHRELEVLDISMNNIQNSALPHLLRLKKLKKLNLSATHITPFFISKHLKELTHLRSVAAFPLYITNPITDEEFSLGDKGAKLYYYSQPTIFMYEAMEEFTHFNDYCGDDSTRASGRFAAHMFRLIHTIVGGDINVPLVEKEILLAKSTQVVQRMAWCSEVLTVAIYYIASIITASDIQPMLLKHDVAFSLLPVLVQCAQAKNDFSTLAMYTLFAVSNLAMINENRALYDIYGGTILTYKIMKKFDDLNLLEYGCYCITNMNWPSAAVKGLPAQKVAKLLLDTISREGASEPVICAALGALRNFTCDLRETVEVLTTSSSLAKLMTLLNDCVSTVESKSGTVELLRLENGPPHIIQSLESTVTQQNEIVFGLCSLLWNLSEDDRNRIEIFDNCFQSMMSIAHNHSRLDKDIPYFIAMVFGNLLLNDKVLEKRLVLCQEAARIVQTIVDSTDCSKKVRTEWGSFKPLYLLLVDWKMEESPLRRSILQVVGKLSLFVLANMTFRYAYQKRLILEGAVNFLTRATSFELPDYNKYIQISLKNFIANGHATEFQEIISKFPSVM